MSLFLSEIWVQMSFFLGTKVPFPSAFYDVVEPFFPYARARQALTSFACKQAPPRRVAQGERKKAVIGGNLGGRDGSPEGPRNRGDKALKGGKARPTRPKCAEEPRYPGKLPPAPLFFNPGRGVQGVSVHSLAGGAGGGGAPPARGSGVPPERGRNVSGFFSSQGREGGYQVTCACLCSIPVHFSPSGRPAL